MGNDASRFFPVTVLDCKTANSGVEGARYDYQCATADRVRYGLTLVHLLTLVVIFLISLLLYLVYWRICERRVYAQLRAVPKRLPIGRDVLSLRMHAAIIESFARVSRDVYCPAPERPIPPPPALAVSSSERARFRAGVYSALQRLSLSLRAALADELHLLRDGLRGARGLLVGPRFQAPSDAVDDVLCAMTLAGLDYRGDVERESDDEGESEDASNDTASDAADGSSTARNAPGQTRDDEVSTVKRALRNGPARIPQRVRRTLPVSSEGVNTTEAAVDAIIAALEGAGPPTDRGAGSEGMPARSENEPVGGNLNSRQRSGEQATASSSTGARSQASPSPSSGDEYLAGSRARDATASIATARGPLNSEGVAAQFASLSAAANPPQRQFQGDFEATNPWGPAGNNAARGAAGTGLPAAVAGATGRSRSLLVRMT